MLPPWQNGIPQHGLRGLVIGAIVRPILAIMKFTMATVIQARGTEVGVLTSCHRNTSFYLCIGICDALEADAHE